MPGEEYNNHVEALAVKRLDKPKKLSRECAQHWTEIVSGQYNFDRGTRAVSSSLFHGMCVCACQYVRARTCP